MREIVLRVSANVVEAVLDRLLPIVPAGVREIPDGEHVELRMRGGGLPSLTEVSLRVRHWPNTLSEHQVPDDWRERALRGYRHELIGGRLVVRPEWAPPADPGLIDIALSDDLAFGSGSHPSTRAILLALLAVTPIGSFADLGCGSGVVGILAAKLGWSSVAGIEIMQSSAESARANALRNAVEITITVADLCEQPPPPAAGFVANIPAPVHLAVAGSAAIQAARWGIISGFGPAHESELTSAYAAAGLLAGDSQELHGWSVVTLRRR
ncbi:MAG: 50S ribosomal protein L11 methyltransferase [Solirubrobacteraceae bacterium]